MSGVKEDLTRDMPNPPQPQKVEEVTKQLPIQQQSSGDVVSVVPMEGMLLLYWQVGEGCSLQMLGL